MNLNLVKIKLIVLILVIESHGGVIEGVYGRIKNTTSGLQQDVRNVWTYSKGMVGLEDPAEEHKDGLVGGAIHSVQDKLHNFHEKVWAVEDIPNDSGLLWNMYNRLKQRLVKAKNYLLSNKDNVTEVNTEPPIAEIDLINETMNKLFNSDGTRKIEGLAFDAAVENLRKKLEEMRKGATRAPVTHGEGIIDLRLSDINKIDKDTSITDTSVIQSVSNDIYDKVDDGIQSVKDNSEIISVAIPDLNPHLNKGVQSVKDGYNKVSDGAASLAGNVLDEAAKERDLLDQTSNKLAQKAKTLGDNVKQSADDAARLAYS